MLSKIFTNLTEKKSWARIWLRNTEAGKKVNLKPGTVLGEAQLMDKSKITTDAIESSTEQGTLHSEVLQSRKSGNKRTHQNSSNNRRQNAQQNTSNKRQNPSFNNQSSM